MDRVNCPHCNETLKVRVKSYSVLSRDFDSSELKECLKYVNNMDREEFRDGYMYYELLCRSCEKMIYRYVM